jgi:hypothetical protein
MSSAAPTAMRVIAEEPLEPAGVAGDADGVDAVAAADLGDGVGQVVAHRRRGQRQAGGDLVGGMPLPAWRSTSVSRSVRGLVPVSRAAATRSGSITRSPPATRRMPSMSTTATSGRVAWAVGRIWSPRSSSATTSMSSSGDSNATRAPRIRCWSSAIKTRIMGTLAAARPAAGSGRPRRVRRWRCRQRHERARPGRPGRCLRPPGCRPRR